MFSSTDFQQSYFSSLQYRDVPWKNQARYKTIMCENYRKTGTCKFGQNCSFAHGIGELRQKTGYHHLMNSIYPISPLSPYASDQFGLGYGCNQYHSVNGIGSEASYGVHQCQQCHCHCCLYRCQHGTQRRPMKMNPALWKTVLCENYLKAGGCKFGTNCMFAHGNGELRQKEKESSYSTGSGQMDSVDSFLQFITSKTSLPVELPMELPLDDYPLEI